MNYLETLARHFPNALTEASFVSRTYQALLRYGFGKINTLACLCLCRDELTRPLADEIENIWGHAFQLSSLSGMVVAGKTSFAAARDHVPQTDGRERTVYFALPHIAIGREGEIGQCYRPGRIQPSVACGALAAFRQNLLSGQFGTEMDTDDMEQSLLRARLLPNLPTSAVPDLVSLTQLAYAVILEDLERMISLTLDPATSDYAVLTGIQIHGPDRLNYVWPGVMYGVVSGQRQEILPL